MKKYIIILAAAAPLMSYSQQKWSLDMCIDYAHQHNLTIRKSENSIRTAEINLFSAKKELLPTVSATVSEDFVNNGTAAGLTLTTDAKTNLLRTLGGVKASMPLFDNYRINNLIKSNEFSLEAASQNLELAKKNIDIKIATSYMQTLYYRNMASVYDKQNDVCAAIVTRAQALYDSGKRPYSELAEAQAQQASNQYQLIQTKGNADVSLLELAQLLNMEYADTFDIMDVKSEINDELPSLREVSENAASKYPSVLSAWSQLQAAKHDLKVAKRDLYPKATLEVNAQTAYFNQLSPKDSPFAKFPKQFFDTNLYEMIGVHVNIPIFNRFQTRAKISKAQTAIVDKQLSLDEARLNIVKDIQTVWTNAKVAYSKYLSALKAEESTLVSFNYIQESYNVGRSTMFNLLEAQQKHFKAQQDAIQARYEYLIRVRILEFYRNL